MGIRNNDLVQFNATMLLNKREVIESFEDFIAYYRNSEDEGSFSGNRRKMLLNMCEQFQEKLQNGNIPAIVKPWYCYEYYVTNDSIILELVKYERVEFDDEGSLVSSTSAPEYTLAEVKCDYLSVEQYAELYDVTVTTVRQWIRRGKLRTAKKVGREWQIPALADTPKRGFEPVTYYWKELPEDIKTAFPFLADTECIFITQDQKDKNMFPAITGWPGADNRQKLELSIQQREQLELMLIASDEVKVETLNILFLPNKRNSSLPLIPDEVDGLECPYDTIVVVPHSERNTWFYSADEPGEDFANGEPDEYTIPVVWDFWGIDKGDEDTFSEAMEGNFSNCVKLGEMTGQLVLGEEMLSDGHDPVVMCDDLDADLGYMMYHLTKENGPLNEETGDPYENVLYIMELTVDPAVRNQNVGSRILRELPWLCKKLVHIKPGIISYIVSAGMEKENVDILESFYGKNGFQKIQDSLLMYAYTE